MDLQRLAAKQKRYKDILRFAEHEVPDPVIKPHLLNALKSYQAALAACWNKQACEPSDITQIASIERELEKLHNDARLRVSSK